MYREKEFINFIKNKAKEKGLLNEAIKELELFSKYGQIEYLYVLHDFIQRIKKKCVPEIMIRMAGANSVIGYLLGFHKNNPKEYPLFNELFFRREYSDGAKGPRFDFSVPKSKKEEVLEILEQIEPIDQEKSKGSIFFFGKRGQFRIGIFESELLDRLCSAVRLIKEDHVGQWSKLDFSKLDNKKVLDYMFAFDNKGYLMPNLHGCLMGITSKVYEFMEACELHSLYELALLNCIRYGVFKDKELVIRSLKQDGLEGTICCKEQLLDILINRYDVDENTAFFIMESLFARHHLSESEELILKSHEVGEGIIAQLNNINYLHYLSFSMEEIKVAYLLAEIKSFLIDDFGKLIRVPFKNSYVGPFFFIDKKIYTYKDPLKSFDGNLRVIDSLMSHVDFFKTLGISGDCSKYPRGRVFFDQCRHRFIVYLDMDLMNVDNKALIIEEYNLDKYRTHFEIDECYENRKR